MFSNKDKDSIVAVVYAILMALFVIGALTTIYLSDTYGRMSDHKNCDHSIPHPGETGTTTYHSN